MSLKPADLVDAMQSAFGDEWVSKRGAEPPEAGKEDRGLLFAAVARGLLTYLDNHHDEILSEVTFQDGDQDPRAHRVVSTKLDIER